MTKAVYNICLSLGILSIYGTKLCQMTLQVSQFFQIFVLLFSLKQQFHFVPPKKVHEQTPF